MNESSRIREVKLIPIGKSLGIRLPKTLLDKYGWSDSLMLVEMKDCIVLRGKETQNVSWDETYRAMATESEDWTEFNDSIADGVD